MTHPLSAKRRPLLCRFGLHAWWSHRVGMDYCSRCHASSHRVGGKRYINA